ncbi:hypothetical protein BBK36DRAFT_1155661 [Trichoderma citrinoviride]|uniref:Uncharacterized protein n=1 Tax=Trichoderma citrinoviride TaxID=58853 RepID=A0A2T4BNI8_9HYPO|nr:hypothetical protein BBK36DRAFT_1155661 [Trichoderma citrinoviride]PTB70877.1 hypothetical protein BBK36DRAFT_1155661 [Trichoderma citrinoviride]
MSSSPSPSSSSSSSPSDAVSKLADKIPSSAHEAKETAQAAAPAAQSALLSQLRALAAGGCRGVDVYRCGRGRGRVQCRHSESTGHPKGHCPRNPDSRKNYWSMRRFIRRDGPGSARSHRCDGAFCLASGGSAISTACCSSGGDINPKSGPRSTKTGTWTSYWNCASFPRHYRQYPYRLSFGRRRSTGQLSGSPDCPLCRGC